MSHSVCSASHASTIIDNDQQSELSGPGSPPQKFDPYLVRFDENDPANPMARRYATQYPSAPLLIYYCSRTGHRYAGGTSQ